MRRNCATCGLGYDAAGGIYQTLRSWAEKRGKPEPRICGICPECLWMWVQLIELDPRPPGPGEVLQ